MLILLMKSKLLIIFALVLFVSGSYRDDWALGEYPSNHYNIP